MLLPYIKNVEKRFRTFVANRITLIHSESTTSQWRHIDTGLNPADDVSRGLTAQEMILRPRWYNGPEFLMKGIEHWPNNEDISKVDENDFELKPEKQNTVLATQKHSDDFIKRVIERRPSWYALKKDIAWILRCKAFLLNRTKKQNVPSINFVSPLTSDDLEMSENAIIKYVQESHFSEEIKCLKDSDMHIKKTSPIVSLDPMLGEDNILRVGGRLKHGPFAYDTKHPIILPQNHHLVTLLVTY